MKYLTIFALILSLAACARAPQLKTLRFAAIEAQATYRGKAVLTSLPPVILESGAVLLGGRALISLVDYDEETLAFYFTIANTSQTDILDFDMDADITITAQNGARLEGAARADKAEVLPNTAAGKVAFFKKIPSAQYKVNFKSGGEVYTITYDN
ncbi:MAG: hypothetical protein LBR90_02580 [Elusimicrobiota bacterium]|jgi:hypothetical protein|nr:hypothetical protein [Elusimicrobiota bacterium]